MPRRFRIIGLIIIAGSLVLSAYLFYYQVWDSEFKRQAQNRTLTKRVLIPPRGNIYDRHDRLIVVNEPSYDLDIIYKEIDKNFDKAEFCRLLHLTTEEFDILLKNVVSKPYFSKSVAIPFITSIPPEDYSRFQELIYKFPGFYPALKNRRSYPLPYGGHLLGYISEVDEQDLILNKELFSIGDTKGSNGVEKTYDTYLRGTKGLEYVLKDNIGREVESFQNGTLDTSAIAGGDLQLSIDIELQGYGEFLMQNKRGSIIAIQPQTGEILSIVSSPGYDPNALSLGPQRNRLYLQMLSDTINMPLLDRSMNAIYPPGSIFKTVLGLISLQEGITRPNKSFNCSGKYVVNPATGFSQKCRNHPFPGDIQTALQWSCNSYFFQMFRDFIDQFGATRPGKGMDLMKKYLDSFGLGRTLGIDIPGEQSGFVPDAAYFDKKYNTSEYSWRSTYMLSMGIGQGELQLTTIQMANLAAIIANRGYYIVPHVVRSLRNGKELPEKLRKPIHVNVDKKHFEPVIEGMYRVIHAGTARRANIEDLEICGKTGTAQNPHGEDHSVFFGFGPRDNAQIAIAVFVENAGGGGALAAPIGGLMMEMYMNGKIAEIRKAEEQRILDWNLVNVP